MKADELKAQLRHMAVIATDPLPLPDLKDGESFTLSLTVHCHGGSVGETATAENGIVSCVDCGKNLSKVGAR